jgi:hypothetical protein
LRYSEFNIFKDFGEGVADKLCLAQDLALMAAIRYSRGRIRIVNLEGLREASCECYATVEAHYNLLCSAR